MHWCTQPANINVSIRSSVRLTQDVLSYAHQIAGVVENGYEAVPLFVVETDAQAVQAVERPAGERREGAPQARATVRHTLRIFIPVRRRGTSSYRCYDRAQLHNDNCPTGSRPTFRQGRNSVGTKCAPSE